MKYTITGIKEIPVKTIIESKEQLSEKELLKIIESRDIVIHGSPNLYISSGEALDGTGIDKITDIKEDESITEIRCNIKGDIAELEVNLDFHVAFATTNIDCDFIVINKCINSDNEDCYYMYEKVLILLNEFDLEDIILTELKK